MIPLFCTTMRKNIRKIPTKHIVSTTSILRTTQKDIIDRWEEFHNNHSPGVPTCKRSFCMQCGKITCQDCTGCIYNITSDKCVICFRDLASYS